MQVEPLSVEGILQRVVDKTQEMLKKNKEEMERTSRKREDELLEKFQRSQEEHNKKFQEQLLATLGKKQKD
jgi:C4-type Zn-finger protein